MQTVLDEAGLSLQGRSRAANIPKVFGKGFTAPDTYNTPDIIYAMKQGKVRPSSNDHSFGSVGILFQSQASLQVVCTNSSTQPLIKKYCRM